MKLFLGEYDHSLDERGRVTIPKKIRQELESAHIVLSKGFESCVFAFDIREWERQAEQQLESPVTDKEGRNVRRYLFSGAEKVEIDKLGRILVPALLKEYANINGEVVIVGAGDHFELWNKSDWIAYTKTLETS